MPFNCNICQLLRQFCTPLELRRLFRHASSALLKFRNINDEELNIVSKRGLAAARSLAKQETSPQPHASI
jgi:hypothetical protein